MSAKTGSSKIACDGLPIPGKLVAAFSTPADLDGIERLLSDPVKTKIDPECFVLERPREIFVKHVDEGSIVILKDEAENVRAMSASYRIGGLIETGTCLTGLNSGTGSIVISLSALEAFMRTGGEKPVVSKMKPSNVPAFTAYRHRLKWELITSTFLQHDLNEACKGAIISEPQNHRTQWFLATKETLGTMAEILLAAGDRGIRHKSNRHIRFELTEALKQIGLDSRKLKEISKGKSPLDGSPLRPQGLD